MSPLARHGLMLEVASSKGFGRPLTVEKTNLDEGGWESKIVLRQWGDNGFLSPAPCAMASQWQQELAEVEEQSEMLLRQQQEREMAPTESENLQTAHADHLNP